MGVQGTVVDANGTIILPGAAILPGVPPSQLKDFKVYRPGSTEPANATYLGQDALTGWHFIRVEEKSHWSQALDFFRPQDASPSEGFYAYGIISYQPLARLLA